MIAVPRRAQRDERLVRLVRGGRVDVERRAVALAKVAPDREATDHRPRACGVSDLVKAPRRTGDSSTAVRAPSLPGHLRPGDGWIDRAPVTEDLASPGGGRQIQRSHHRMDDTVSRRGDDEWRGSHRHLDDRLVGPVPEAMTIEQCLESG